MNTFPTYPIDLTDPYATTHPVEMLGFPYDYAPGCGDHHIDPFRDRDGQPCAPEYWGFERVHMGGGIMGYELNTDEYSDDEETYLLTTPEAGCELPSPNHWALGCYVLHFQDAGGEQYEPTPHWMVEVKPHGTHATLTVTPAYHRYLDRSQLR